MILSGVVIPVPGEGSERGFAPNPIIQEMIWKVTAPKMYSTIYDLQNFSTRYTFSQNISLAAQYIRDRFNASGLITEFQELDVNGKKVNNVIGILKGVNASSNITYIIGAHYDSISSDSDPMTLAPGADDDGSGTAGVILAADAMSKYKFDKTIKFIAFPGEEQGLYGSRFYVQNINRSSEFVGAMFNLDMIISANTQKAVTIHANTPSQWMGDRMAEINTEYGLGLSITKRYNNPTGASDHKSFWDGGYSATLCIETYFSNYYHKKSDIVQNYPYPLGFEQGANITQMNIALLAEIAGVIPGSAGMIRLDKPVYPLNGIARISLYDDDLKNTGSTRINVSSTTETNPEPVTLFETPSGSGIFEGWIQMAPGTPRADGVLQVSHGDDVIVLYADSNPRGDRKSVSRVDGIPPIISSVRVWDFTNSSVSVSWVTDEDSNTTVFYGMGNPVNAIHINEMVKEHYVWIRNLTPDKTYSLMVRSADAVGNTRTDDNSGAYYKFVTGSVSYTLMMPNGGWVSSDENRSFEKDDLFAGYDSSRNIWYESGIQIRVPPLPEGYRISRAYLGLAYQKRDYLRGANGSWTIDLLSSSIDDLWQNINYTILDSAPVDVSAGTILNPEMKEKRWNTIEFTQGAIAHLYENIKDGKASFRIRTQDPDIGYANWDTGYDYGSMGREYAPVLTLYLTPSFGSVEGYVKNRESRPLSGANVSIGALNTITNTDGYYILDKIPSGTHIINVSVKGYTGSSKSILVAENIVTHVDFVLEPLSGNISGQIRSTEGRGIPSACVILVDLSMKVTADSDGFYSFRDIPPGEYTLKANASGYLDAHTRVFLQPGEDLRGVDLELERIITAGWILGSVIDRENNQPLANVSIIIRNKTGNIVASIRTNASGGFNLTLPAGVYRISADLEGYQPQDITNFVVYPAQVSSVIIALHRVSSQGDETPSLSLWSVVVLPVLLMVILIFVILIVLLYRRKKNAETQHALWRKLYEWGEPKDAGSEHALRKRLAMIEPLEAPVETGNSQREVNPSSEKHDDNALSEYLREIR